MTHKLKILTFSALYPNATAPHFGVFVETRLRQLLQSGEVEARVVAPVPWFPLGDYRKLAAVPPRDRRNGIDVRHPRYPHVPGLGVYVQPMTMYLAVRAAVAQIRREGFDFDLIDAHYFYPDGVAAALLAREFDRPFVVTSRGTDLVTLAHQAVPGRWVKWAAARAAGLITVSASLKQELLDLGVPGDKVRVLRNGVDLRAFQPRDRAAARARFGLEGRVIASVGHLIPRKGNQFIIRALPSLPGVTLAIAGGGPERDMLEGVARDLGVANQVKFLGVLSQDNLPDLYSAADVLVLASSHEGWPNVLLEAMACGTPVAATAVSGSPEIVTAPAAGVLMPDRQPATIASRVAGLLAALPDRAATRAFAEDYSWEATTQGQLVLFRSILARSGPMMPPAPLGHDADR